MYKYDKREFDFSRVAQGAMSAIGANLGVFTLLALIFGAAPQLLQGLAQSYATTGSLVPAAVPADGFPPAGPSGTGPWLVLIAAGIVAFVALYMLQAAVMRGTVDHLNGRRTQFSDCLGTGLRFTLPLVGIAIISGIGVGLGFLIFIIPGLFLMVMWVVAAPVAVIERKGVFASLSRSGDLTLGHRWVVLGLLVAYFVILLIGSMLIGLLFGAVVLMFGAFGPWVDLVFTAVLQGAFGLLGAAGIASLYYELRSLKEDVGPSELARVFD